ncbi:unnamed protein product, partial [Laminaria digitata]
GGKHGGGTLWKDIQEGSPRASAGDGRGFGGGDSGSGGSRSDECENGGGGGFHETLAAGLSMGPSSSGLKGLKTSLLTEDDDFNATPTAKGRPPGTKGRKQPDGKGGGSRDRNNSSHR